MLWKFGVNHIGLRFICSHRSSRPEVFCKKGVPKNFAKFTGKHLCRSLFLTKLQALGLELYWKVVLRNFAKFTWKHLCQSLFVNKTCNFMKKETLVQAFSCEFCEISKNTFYYRTPLMAASGVVTIDKV